MKKIFLLLFIVPILAMSQDKNLFEKHILISNGDTLSYRLLLPKNYDASKTYPVVFFLHGSGERGNDNEKQLVHGSKLFLNESNRDSFPAIVVFPQCSQNGFWSNVTISKDGDNYRSFQFLKDGEPTVDMKLLILLVHDIENKYPVNKEQEYVGGLSMGGMGTFELIRRLPNTFAAAISICGGAEPSTAKKIASTPLWIFHGMKDDVVPPENSINMYKALQKTNAEVHLTLYPDANHNSWDSTFAEPGLLKWLFEHTRK